MPGIWEVFIEDVPFETINNLAAAVNGNPTGEALTIQSEAQSKGNYNHLLQTDRPDGNFENIRITGDLPTSGNISGTGNNALIETFVSF